MRIPYSSRWLAAVAVGLVSFSWPGDAQQPAPAPARAAGSLATGVRAVLVDVVVRDRRGQPVRDLQPSDFEVLEDGVPQVVGSFMPVFESAPSQAPPVDAPPAPAPVAAQAAASAGPGAQDPMGEPVTALVFDRLSPEARRLAVQAARRHLGDKKEAPNPTGVFGIDLAFTPYAPFTKDADLLRKALDQIENRASSTFNVDRERRAQLSQGGDSARQAAAAGAASAGPGGAQNASASATAQLAEMEVRMMDEFEALERDQQGYATTNGLFAIINTLRPLKGRKSVLLFSEGVSIPPAVQRLFLGVIDAANRANVSIYTMDAAGLRVDSEQRKIADEVNRAGQRGLTAYASTGKASEPLTKDLEKNEDVLRQDPHTGLGELAQGTGGLIFENTNNLRQGLEQLETDHRNYYLLGYTPTDPSYDGRFRSIEVRVKRSGLTVAARKGYFAVRDMGGAPVNAWEAPALGALEQRPVPNAFPFRAAALSFPQATTKVGTVPVLVELKTAPMSFPATEDAKGFKSDFAIIVRFLGPDGRVVRKVSQHYEMAAEMAQLELAKNSEVLFYREAELPPGLYTMESIVYDHPSKKASVRYSMVEVPRIDPAKLRMSSLIVVNRGEKVSETEPKDGPLFVNDVLIYPNLSGDVSKAAKELGFYFTVYPGTPSPAPQAFLEIIQNGKALAQIPLTLESADASGRIKQVGRLPLEALAPGTYQLRAVVKQGSQQASSTTVVRVTG